MLNSLVRRTLICCALTFLALGVSEGQGAGELRVLYGPSYGTGGEFFRVAVLSDPHVTGGGDSNAILLAKSVKWINDNISEEKIKLTVITGDICQPSSPSVFSEAKTILDSLHCPYVPMPGNHDVWINGQDVADADTVGMERYFNSTFQPQYSNLSAIANAKDSVLARWDQCRHKSWTWYDDSINDALRELHHPRYSIFHDFSFDIGPGHDNSSGDTIYPFHFLCLDFNSRESCVSVNGGVNPDGDGFAQSLLSWYQGVQSMQVNCVQGHESEAYVDFFSGTNYTGQKTRYSPGEYPQFTNNWLASSVQLGPWITSVVLFDNPDFQGAKRLHLDPGFDSEIPDLSVTGCERWWRNDLSQFHSRNSGNQENVVIFAHHPLGSFYFDLGPDPKKDVPALPAMTFSYPEYERIVDDCLNPFRGDIAGWISGHLHSIYGVFHLWHVKSGGNEVCPCYVCRANGIQKEWTPACERKYRGVVHLLTFHFTPGGSVPVLSQEEFDVAPSPFDPVESDSVRISFSVNIPGNLTIGVFDRGSCIRALASNQYFNAGSNQVAWDGRDQDGNLADIGDEYYAEFWRGSDFEGYMPLPLSGTLLSGELSGVLPKSGSPYILSDDISIPASDTLRIEGGSRIMSTGVQKVTVMGKLIAAGSATQPVLLTPYRRLSPSPDSTHPGAWQGIRIDDQAGACCSLDHCIIEYAGNPVDGDSAAIVCKKAGGLSLTNSVVRYSSTRGFWARSSINNNEVLLRGDTFEHIAGYPASVLAESVGSVVNSCTFRNNSNPALDVQSNSFHKIRRNANWLCCEPGWRYDIDGTVYVNDTGGPSCCSLMVGAGATIRMGKDHKLEIGSSSASNRTGYLGAWSQGARITFTGMDTLNPSNYWKGIELSSNSRANMESCDVSYSQEDAVSVRNNAICQPWYSTFRRSQCGVHLGTGSNSTLSAQECQFVQNDTGVKFGGDCGTGVIRNCLFGDNSRYGLYAGGKQYVQLDTNTFVDNNIPVRIRANLVYPLLCNNYFQNNAWHGVEIGDGSVAASQIADYARWFATPDVNCYRCFSDVKVYAPSLGDEPDSGGTAVTSPNVQVPVTGRIPSPNVQPGLPAVPPDLGQRHGDWYRPGIMTPGEWARAHPGEFRPQINTDEHGLVVNYEKSRARSGELRLQTSTDELRPQPGVRVATYSPRWQPQTAVESPDRQIDAGREGGANEAPLLQANGGRGKSFDIPTLVIDPGATVEFPDGSDGLQIGYGSRPAALTASGLANSKITFTCFEAGGQWDGIHLYAVAGSSYLAHCRILNAGHSSSEGGVSLRCAATLKRCEIGSCANRGIYVYHAAPHLVRCNVHDCGYGIYVNSANASPTASVDTCGFTANNYGIYSSSYPRATFRNCNVAGNYTYGAFAAKSWLDCTKCWWGASNGPRPNGSGDLVNGYVTYHDSLVSQVQIEPPLDVSAIGLYPTGTYNQDSLVVNPQGRAHNNYDEVLTFPTRMSVGANYVHDQSIGLAGGQSGWLAFPAITLHRGTYRIVYKTMLTGDETPANDSIVDSVTVRALRDVSARRVVQPSGSEYEVLDTVPFAVMVGNNFDSLLTVPVKFWRNDTLRETLSVALQPHDSSTVWFDSCRLAEGVYRVTYATYLTNDAVRQNDTVRCQFSVGPAKDAAARFPISPAGLILSDTPCVVTPTGWVRNNYDDTLTIPVRMRIGGSCVRDTHVFVSAKDSAAVSFLPCTLALGSYLVSMVTHLTGDEIPANDSIAETLLVRRPIDAAVARLLAPQDSVYTIEDAIPLGAMVANHWSQALSFPVRLLRNDTLLDQHDVEVPGLDSVEVWFDARRLRHGNHTFKFVAGLDSDERRWNDTLAKTIRVKSGDYWVMLDSAPAAQARLTVDSAGRVYAAARSSLRVDFYDPASNLWNRLSDPPMTAVYGITAIDTAVYVLGTGAYQGLTTGPGIWSYEPENDTWLFVTACDSSVQLGSGSNLVGTHDRTIYIVGCGTQVFRYFLARDSWAVVPGAPTTDYWGAADWMDGRLYAVASNSSLWRFDEGNGQWSSLPGPGAGTSYGSALACDRAAERAFAFWHGGTSGTGKGFSELRDTGRVASQLTWLGRQSLASETLGAAMCFGATQGYGLDGKGGFWRYRPKAVFDLAAIDLVMPETVHADTPFAPVAFAQNNWEDSLSCQLTLQVGGHNYSPWVGLPPQSRIEHQFGSMQLSPGTYQTLFQVSRSGPDSIPANDRRSGSLFVPLRHDAAAVQILGVSGWVRYDSLLHPAGVISNLWSDSLDIRVMLAVDSVFLESTVVRVPSQHTETIWFDTCRLSIGSHATKLGVGIEHDELAQNDTFRSSANVVGNGWLPVHPAPTKNPVLCDGEDSMLYAADHDGSEFNEYNMLQDSWRSLAEANVKGMTSLSRAGNEIFGLGMSGATGCIERYRTDLDQWSLVAKALPVKLSDACGLVARDSLTLYLVGPVGSGSTGNFWRYDVVGDSWHGLAAMPTELPHNWVSCTSDQGDFIYVLTGPSRQVYQYSIGDDDWTLLTVLPQLMITPAALSIDVQRNLLPALGHGMLTSAQSAEFSPPHQTWSSPVPFPGFTPHPSLAVSNGRLFGTGGGSTAAPTFAEYVRVALDVAALDIVALPDTFRSDSVPLPGGVVRNLSWAPVTCQAILSCSTSQQQQRVQLAPMQYDTVWFSTITYPPGRQAVSLTVSCEGDENPGNDVVSRKVFVRAPWVPRAPGFLCGRLDSDTSAVFAADAQSGAVMRYVLQKDYWDTPDSSPFEACLDLGYWDGSLYVLGTIEHGQAGKGRARLADNMPARDVAGYEIYQRALWDAKWQLVCALPDSSQPGWLIPTGEGLYLLPGSGRTLWRYDTGGWTERQSLPVDVVGAAAADWDRSDTFFFTFVSDSGAREFLRYSVTGDTWLALLAPPESGMALAVEPGGNRVLMMTLDSLGSALFEYDRTQDAWTRSEDAPPQAYPGMALCFAEDDAWLVTGGQTEPSSFWQCDPDFQGSADRKGGLGGTAGWSEQLQHPCLTCEPNPFDRSCRITYALPKPGRACLKLYDVTGRLVMTLANGYTTTGNHVTNVSARGLANGIYLLKLESADYRATRKLILE